MSRGLTRYLADRWPRAISRGTLPPSTPDLEEEIPAPVLTLVESDFDPADHTVAEVLAYLESRPDRRESVLEAEAAGKARKSILSA